MPPSSTRTTTRPRQSRIQFGIALLAAFACLTSPALANRGSLPSETAATLPIHHRAVVAVAEQQPAPTNTPSSLYARRAEDLKLKPRQKDDDDDSKSGKDEDEDDQKTSSTEHKDDKEEGSQQTKTVTVDVETTVTEKKSSPARTTTMKLSVTVSEPTGSPSPLPAAFDGSVASEFQGPNDDNSCPNFMENLLGSPEFQRCYPLSMLVQTSNGFFQAQKSLVSIVRVLDASCKADVDTCSQFMRAAARNLTESDNCETEWENGLNTVMQAYRGLMAYEIMYAATCLQDPQTENYCFATAVTNMSTPSDTYLFFLPYNLSMPGSSTPSCTWCNQEIMGIFHSAAADRRQLIANTYEGAARQLDTMCGNGFVNSTLPEAEEGASGFVHPHGVLALTIVLASVILNLVI